ncbi:MAG: helix-turn-helix domain-containing protein [Minisyncoccia bacterium]
MKMNLHRIMNDNKIKKNEINLENYTCGAYLKYVREQKNINLNKASEDLKILKDILEKIEKDEYSSLPPKAYLKGIIKKYARYLNISEDFILHLYEKSNGRSLSSGKNDLLPRNRFEIKKFKVLKVIGQILGRILEYLVFIIIIFYVFFELSQLILPAKIEIFYPPNNLTTNQANLKIRGVAIRAKKLYFQEREISLINNTQFTEEILLKPGINNFQFKAINALGKETVLGMKVIYYPQ